MAAFEMWMIKVDDIAGRKATHNKGSQRYLSATA